jgi:hypothetical protein
MKYKIEIVDNQIGGFYKYDLYSWKKKYWFSKEKWHFVTEHILGYEYMSHEIRGCKITAGDYFELLVQSVLISMDISEIHRTVITKN